MKATELEQEIVDPVLLQQLLAKHGLSTSDMGRKEILSRVYKRLSEWAITDADNEDISIEFYSSMLMVRFDISMMLSV